MENLMIETLTQDINALREQLSLINKRAEQIENNIELLKQHLEALQTNKCEQDEQENLPEIEVELIVDENDAEEFEETAQEEQTAEAEQTAEVEQTEEQQGQETEATATEDAKEDVIKEDVIEKEEKTLGINLPPINDIRKAISLGDRFLFQRELFQGDGEKMNKTIDSLNKLNSLDEAIAYINKKFAWDKESQAYELFTNILKRRY